jgi:hypothetical protein
MWKTSENTYKEESELARSSLTMMQNNMLQYCDGINKIRLSWEFTMEKKVDAL